MKMQWAHALIVFGWLTATQPFLAPMKIVGRDGRDLQRQWFEGAEAYLGTTVPNFPNMFIVYGPNTTVANSVIFMMESQIHYIMKMLMQVVRRNTVFEVKQQIADRFNADIQRRAASFTWTSGCRNWFVSSTGKLVNNWPASTMRYYWLTRFLRKSDYDISER